MEFCRPTCVLRCRQAYRLPILFGLRKTCCNHLEIRWEVIPIWTLHCQLTETRNTLNWLTGKKPGGKLYISRKCNLEFRDHRSEAQLKCCQRRIMVNTIQVFLSQVVAYLLRHSHRGSRMDTFHPISMSPETNH